jgi:hypothetical protein
MTDTRDIFKGNSTSNLIRKAIDILVTKAVLKNEKSKLINTRQAIQLVSSMVIAGINIRAFFSYYFHSTIYY